LLRIARPPILFYGIYAAQNVLRADRRLLGLVTVRTRLAEELDSFAECGCDAPLVQGALDLCLHSLDRAIDLYAAGREEFGVAECRASAFAYLILAVEELLSEDARDAADKFLAGVARRAEIETEIKSLFPNESERQLALAEWRGIVHRVTVLDGNMQVIQPTLKLRARTLADIQSSLDDAIRLLAPFATPPGDWDNEARTGFFEESRIRIRTEELCAQLRQEQGWGTLVPGLVQRASNEGRLVGAEGALEWLVRRAVVLNEHLIGQAAGADLPPLFLTHDCPTGIDIPPHYETLLDGIAFDVGRGGNNR
jgi:hypothetical protein